MRTKVKSDLIQRLRKDRNWTQENLSEFSGVHSRTIQRLENDGFASARSLSALAKALEVDPDKLIFSYDEIDFRPLLREMRILAMAIFQRFIPINDKEFPSAFIALIVIQIFLSSVHLNGTFGTVLDGVSLVGLPAILFAPITMGIAIVRLWSAFELFRLKYWAWQFTLAMSLIGVLGHTGAFVLIFLGSAIDALASIVLNLVGLIINSWASWMLIRHDIREMFSNAGSGAHET